MSRRGWIATAVALAALAIGLAVLFLRDPGIAAGAADGAYEHDCCGTISLKGGRMLLGEVKSVDYAVGKDEAGPYILPDTFVGTWEERGFEIDGSRPPLKLRLDRIPRPETIELPAARGTRLFKRKTFRPPPRRP